MTRSDLESPNHSQNLSQKRIDQKSTNMKTAKEMEDIWMGTNKIVQAKIKRKGIAKASSSLGGWPGTGLPPKRPPPKSE